MAKEADFQMLIDMCNKIGWDEGIANLEKIVSTNENLQASLFAGNFNQQKQAQRLSKTIIKQNMSINSLKQYRKEHGL